jgi:hypothetical protein
MFWGAYCKIAALVIKQQHHSTIQGPENKKGIEADDDKYITDEFGGNNDHVKSVATAW